MHLEEKINRIADGREVAEGNKAGDGIEELQQVPLLKVGVILGLALFLRPQG